MVASMLITDNHRYLLIAAVTSGAYVLMSCVSYAAAIASARGYGTVLKAIAEEDRSGKKQPMYLLRRRDR